MVDSGLVGQTTPEIFGLIASYSAVRSGLCLFSDLAKIGRRDWRKKIHSLALWKVMERERIR